MKISKQAQRDAKALFRACLVDGRLDEARVREGVRRVIEARPRGYLAVLEHFRRLLELESARRSARIESAVPLTPELRDRLLSNLSRHYGPGLNVDYAVNPALIGGIRIRVGSDILDSSIQGRLSVLAETF